MYAPAKQHILRKGKVFKLGDDQKVISQNTERVLYVINKKGVPERSGRGEEVRTIGFVFKDPSATKRSECVLKDQFL